jgi:ubiquitin-like 1-activating enzyme E1 B
VLKLDKNMATEIEGVFRPDLRDLILASKILVVGAGGIGCEVLKNLVMCGFKEIEIVSKKIQRLEVVTL